MDRMANMATFVKVVEAGGFAAAGRKLDMSPSTVTLHVQALEERLGVRLLNRSTRKVGVTEVGRAYYERCLQILADADDADNIVQALNSSPRGTLRLNASVTTPVLLAPVIAEFTSLYPEVKLAMTISDRMVDLVEEGIDLAILTMPIPDSNLIVRRIGSFRLMACAAPSYLAARGTPREPDDLMNHSCLTYSFSPWGCDWYFGRADSRKSVRVAGNMESNSVEALKLAAVHGQGLILVPSFLVADELTSGRLIPVLTQFPCPEKPVNAVYQHRHHLSAKVRSFLELVTRHFRVVEKSAEVLDRSAA